MKEYISLILVLALLLLSGCDKLKGPAGPTGSSGTDALTDASVALKVIWTFPTNEQVGPIADLNNYISIRFNKILDMSTVNRSIQMSPSNTPARFDTNNISVPTGDLIYIGLKHDSSYVWNIGQTYTVTVLSTLKDINGNILSSPYSFSFTPEPYFRVTFTNPENGAENVVRSNDIIIEFNNNIDFQSFQASVSISPSVLGTWYYYSGEAYFYPSPQLSPSTTYTITLGTGCKDAQGRVLNKPYTFSLTTRSN